MKYTSAVIMLSGLALSGCSATTYHVAGPEANISVQRASESLAGETVAVVDIDSLVEKVTIVRVSGDSLTFYCDRLEDARAVPLSTVHKVIKAPSTGAKIVGGTLGLTLGYAAGAVAGRAVMEATGSSIVGDDNGGTTAAALLTLACLITGPIVGVSSAPESRYEFSPLLPPEDRKSPVPEQETYSVLHTDSLIGETPDTITISWRGAPRILPKSQIEIERRTNGKYVLKVPKRLLGE